MHRPRFEQAVLPGGWAEKMRVDISGGEIEGPIAGELCQLAYSQRLAERARNVLVSGEGGSTGRALFEGAPRCGAQTFGVAVAGIAVGSPADIVSPATDHTGQTARLRDALIDAWIFSANSTMVGCTRRRSVKLVEKGRHHWRDAAEKRYKDFLNWVLQ